MMIRNSTCNNTLKTYPFIHGDVSECMPLNKFCA